MKVLGIWAIVLGLAAAIAYQTWARIERRSPAHAKSSDVYLGLRSIALQTSRAQIGLPTPLSPKEPWGVVMEWGVAKGTATVVALSDGNASIYLSSGGGYMGGGQSHESVRKAALDMVAAAAECRQQTHVTTVYPLPQQGEVVFYLRTDEGVLTSSASEQELKTHRHPLSKLGDAAQNVITQYQLIQTPR